MILLFTADLCTPLVSLSLLTKHLIKPNVLNIMIVVLMFLKFCSTVGFFTIRRCNPNSYYIPVWIIIDAFGLLPMVGVAYIFKYCSKVYVACLYTAILAIDWLILCYNSTFICSKCRIYRLFRRKIKRKAKIS